MPTIVDTELYNLVKKFADEVYTKNSAYKSGFIVKKYKSLGCQCIWCLHHRGSL